MLIRRKTREILAIFQKSYETAVYRQGKITLQELRLQLYRAVEHGLLLPLFSG